MEVKPSILDMVQGKIADAPRVVRSGNPGEVFELAVECSALLASVNEALALGELKFKQAIAKGIKDEKLAVNAAERLAEATPDYLEYRRAKGTADALEHLITSLRKAAEYLAHEKSLTP